MSEKTNRYLLYSGFIVAVLPVIILRDFTPSNELRYLSIADEALRNHTFFVFTNHGVPYADKPPLYLWIIMLCRWLTGAHRMWLLSLFSVVPALVTVDTVDRWTANEMGVESHAAARLMTLTTGLFLTAALTIRMDMLMTMFIILAMREAWNIINGDSRCGSSRWRFPLWLFLAVLTKGPIGLLIPLTTTVVYLIIVRQPWLIKRLWGWTTWISFGGLTALWLTAVWNEGGSGYLYDMTVHQTVGRAVNSFHHKASVVYYLIHYWYCVAPWSLLVAGIIVKALGRGAKRNALQLFFLTAALSIVALLSCFSAKLQIYMLPAVPFMTYSAAMFLERYSRCPWLRYALALPSAIIVVALPAVLIVGWKIVPEINTTAIVLAATVLSVIGIAALCRLFSANSHGRLLTTINILGSGMLIAVFIGASALPRLNAYIGYSTICHEALTVASRFKTTDIRVWRMKRAENMDVYLHSPVTVIPSPALPLPHIATSSKSSSSDPATASHPYIIISKEKLLKERGINIVARAGDNAVGVAK